MCVCMYACMYVCMYTYVLAISKFYFISDLCLTYPNIKKKKFVVIIVIIIIIIIIIIISSMQSGNKMIVTTNIKVVYTCIAIDIKSDAHENSYIRVQGTGHTEEPRVRTQATDSYCCLQTFQV